VPCPEVDVNVHPTKQEVRFSHPLLIREGVRRALSRLLERAPWQGGRIVFSPTPSIRPWAAESPARAQTTDGSSGKSEERAALAAPGRAASGRPGFYPEAEDREAPPALPVVREEPGGLERQPLLCEGGPHGASGAGRPSLRLIGQYKEAYLICESSEGLLLVDQHAAHERLAYERLEEAFRAGALPQQPLLAPVLVELPPQQAEALRDHLGRLAEWGLEVEAYGGSTFVVKALPSLLAGADAAGLLRDVSEEILSAEKSRRVEDLRRDLFARMACHAVVRAGQGLERREMEALLEQLSSRPGLSVCPHGRPVQVLFPLREIEKRFQRT